MTHRLRRLAALLAASTLAATALVAGVAAPANAAAGVNVSVEGKPELAGVADPTYVTELRVNGSGFQSIQNGFGGIYVMFGWAGDGWQPSQGGTTGADYRYVPDDETNPTGFVSFVTFPGSSTAYAANGGELAADGTWSATLTVPGATFTALDRDGNPSEVNCLQVQCGVITIGAHGVKNANNETFTPVSFRDLYEQDAAGTATAAPVEATPAPTTTTYVTQEPVAPAVTDASAAGATSEDDDLLAIILWAVLGVGILAVLAIAFLVWAVLSSRRRQAKALAAASAGAAAPEDPAPSDGHRS